MKKLIGRILVLAALAFLPLYFLSRSYDSRVSRNIAEKGIWNISLKNNRYDYAVIGSSRAVNVVSVQKIDSCLGTKGVNLGVSGAAFAENLLTLTKFYGSGNSIRYLLIQVDLLGLSDPEKMYEHPFNDQNYLFLIGDPSVDSIICANTNPIKHFFRKTVPGFKYAEYNNIYPINEVYGYSCQADPFTRYGGSALPGRNERNRPSGEVTIVDGIELDTLSCNTLLALAAMARSHGSQVIFFTSPAYTEYLDRLPGNKAAHNHVRALAGDSIPYFDFERCILSGRKEYFRDNTHLNREGIDLFAVMLADSLAGQHLVPEAQR